MPRKPSLSPHRLAARLIAATFAGIVTVAILGSVTELFVRDGWPMATFNPRPPAVSAKTRNPASSPVRSSVSFRAEEASTPSADRPRS
jgi:hypothetical protein